MNNMLRVGNKYKLWSVTLFICLLLLVFEQFIGNMTFRINSVVLTALMIFYITCRSFQEVRKLLRVSQIDELTGLGNYRAFSERFKLETKKAERGNYQISLLLIDLDQFKNYNDTYGHRQGNELLRKTGKIFHDSVRLADGVYRYGGDEFAVIFPETELETAQIIADRIASSFKQLSSRGQVTLSMGLAAFNSSNEVEDQFFDRVDQMLYDVKLQGGDFCQMKSAKTFKDKVKLSAV